MCVVYCVRARTSVRVAWVDSDGSFPRRTSGFQVAMANVLQDLLNSPTASDLVAALGTAFVGGQSESFVFRHVRFHDYPLGGSSVRVLQQGTQVVLAKRLQAFDYGTRENLRRYGSRSPPAYRSSYALLNLPIHFVAGSADRLIAHEDVRDLVAEINEAVPGTATCRVFEGLGHLDFTLGTNDEVISHVLREMAVEPGARRVQRTAGTGAGGGAPRCPRARDCARAAPFLFCYTKLAAAFEGLDKASGAV